MHDLSGIAALNAARVARELLVKDIEDMERFLVEEGDSSSLMYEILGYEGEPSAIRDAMQRILMRAKECL